MINSTRTPKETDFQLKQEGDDEKAKVLAAAASSSTSSAQWLRLKDPRVVRVSRAFGGKDRHSKVCTIRGLRDRRVRLSVPTAIQLYDLQDRLGLNQPSKVVDWLLSAAKHEIDELPPLPNIPTANTNFLHYPPYNSTITSSSNQGSSTTTTTTTTTSHPANSQFLNINRGFHRWQLGSSQNSIRKSKSKEASSSASELIFVDKADWINRSELEEKQGIISKELGSSGGHVVSNHHHHHPSFIGLLNTMPLGGYQFWEPSSTDHHASQLGNIHHGFTTGINSQIFVCPTGATQSYFPSHVTAMEMDQRQIMNQYQMMLSSSSTQNLMSNNNNLNPSSCFSLAMMTTPRLVPSPNKSSESPSHEDTRSFLPSDA